MKALINARGRVTGPVHLEDHRDSVSTQCAYLTTPSLNLAFLILDFINKRRGGGSIRRIISRSLAKGKKGYLSINRITLNQIATLNYPDAVRCSFFSNTDYSTIDISISYEMFYIIR